MSVLEVVLNNLQKEINKHAPDLEQIKKTGSMDSTYYYKLGLYDAYKFAQEEIHKEKDREDMHR